MSTFFQLVLIVSATTLTSSVFADVNASEQVNPPLIGEEVTIEVLPRDFQGTEEQEQKLEQVGYVEAAPAPIAYASNGDKPRRVKSIRLHKARVVAVENEATHRSHHRTFGGIASYYGGIHSRKNVYTAAHRSLPFGTKVRVTHKGRSVIVLINDRGPFIRGRVIDVDRGAARALGLTGVGVGRVVCEVM